MSYTPRTDAAVNAGGNQLLNVATESRLLEKELSAFKKNNEELIQRHNAAIASWDEERERALREADRVKHWREKYEDMKSHNKVVEEFRRRCLVSTPRTEAVIDVVDLSDLPENPLVISRKRYAELLAKEFENAAIKAEVERLKQRILDDNKAYGCTK